MNDGVQHRTRQRRGKQAYRANTLAVLAARPLRAAMAVSALVTITACAGDTLPSAADLPEMMREAASEEAVSRRGESPARRAVRLSLRVMHDMQAQHEREIGTRVRRPHLQSAYLLQPESFIGGSFPRESAVLLREVEQQVDQYVGIAEQFRSVLEGRLAATDLDDAQRQSLADEMANAYAAWHQPVIETNRKLGRFAAAAAELYELAAASPGSLRYMRSGLQSGDLGFIQRFNRRIDELERELETLDAAIRALSTDQQATFSRMGLTKFDSR